MNIEEMIYLMDSLLVATLEESLNQLLRFCDFAREMRINGLVQ